MHEAPCASPYYEDTAVLQMKFKLVARSQWMWREANTIRFMVARMLPRGSEEPMPALATRFG